MLGQTAKAKIDQGIISPNNHPLQSRTDKSTTVSAPLNDLCVYQAGQVRTLVVGLTRVVTLVVFGLGFVAAPNMYYHPDTSNWWVPGVIAGSAIPMVVLTLISAPFVSTIRVQIPPSAKRSQQALMQWASNIPPETRLELQSMRFLPWPKHRSIRISDLRRLPQTRWSMGLANLERVSYHGEPWRAEDVTGGRLVRRLYARYYIDRAQITDKSQAPGLWDRIWEQIPVKGEQPAARMVMKEPVVMANRRQPLGRTSLTGRVRAPPPPPPPAVNVGSKNAGARK